MFAAQVVGYNAAGGSIPIKGIMVGNGCVGDEVGICGSDPHGDLYTLQQLQGHGFIPKAALDNANAACGDWSPPESAACRKAIRDASASAGSNWDIYDLYAGMWNTCEYAQQAKRQRRPVSADSALGMIRARMDEALSAFLKDNNCTNDDDLQTYLGTPAVVAALHVKAPAGGYQVCGGVDYTTSMHDERKEIYPTLVAAGLSITIYNGEADACVPITDSACGGRAGKSGDRHSLRDSLPDTCQMRRGPRPWATRSRARGSRGPRRMARSAASSPSTRPRAARRSTLSRSAARGTWFREFPGGGSAKEGENPELTSTHGPYLNPNSSTQPQYAYDLANAYINGGTL